MVSTAHLLLLGVTAASALSIAAPPKPQLTIVDYYGSACPAGGGIGATIGALNETTNIAPLTFTLPNFTPNLGSFTSALRMCDIIANVTIEPGWKVSVNARGTHAQGYASVDNTTMLALRGTYQFTHNYEVQSVGMLNVDGPVSGQFARPLVPNDGDKGVVGPCEGGQLDIEFQARAVRDVGEQPPTQAPPTAPGTNQTTWTMSTDMEVSRC